MNTGNQDLAQLPEGRKHYPALDGLRGMAILLVVVYHNFGFINVFFFGWLGVDLFFVLSGFLITDILLQTKGRPGFLKNFYLRRILRIFPLYYLTLILFLFILPRLVSSFDVAYYREHQLWLWTYLQNWIYTFQNPGHTNTLNHLWSLAVEEQFYLVWPLAVLLIKNPRHLLLLISLVLVAVLGLRLWAWMTQVADLAYFNLFTFTRVDGICIGCMIALLRQIRPGLLNRYTTAIVLFFAGMNFIFFFVNRRYDFAFPYLALAGYTTFAMIFGLLVNEAVSGSTKWVQLLFTIPVLRFLGRISYGFYIFHWPVYLLLAPVLTQWFAGGISGHPLQILVSVTATLAAIAVSWISFRYYESYFLKWKNRLPA